MRDIRLTKITLIIVYIQTSMTLTPDKYPRIMFIGLRYEVAYQESNYSIY